MAGNSSLAEAAAVKYEVVYKTSWQCMESNGNGIAL